jgi:uncharacterized protein YjbI with pentapeptide repeats
MQILTAYLREHSRETLAEPWKDVGPQFPPENWTEETPSVRADFLAVADVIRRRRSEWDPVRRWDDRGRFWPEPIRVKHSDLREADLRGAELTEADFNEAQLQGTNFGGAQLEGANFRQAQLQRANFGWEAHLNEADFQRARLLSALEQAGVEVLPGRHTVHFRATQLQRADFRGARLEGANFERAQLAGANFSGVDLTLTEGFTQAQLDSTICDETTKPPPELTIRPEPHR